MVKPTLLHNIISRSNPGIGIAVCLLTSIACWGRAETVPLKMSATFESRRVVISWPGSTANYSLEETDQLRPDGEWWPARLATESAGGRHSVSIKPVAARRFYRLATNNYSLRLQTTRGPWSPTGTMIILPHEHVFTDLRGPTTRGYGEADVDDVVRVMKPRLIEAREIGVEVLIECTSIGVGRNVAIIDRLSQESGLPIVVPTGVYGRADFAPPAYRQMTEDQLAQVFRREIQEGIDGTTIKAGFIKIATSATGLTALEERILRASGRAAKDTGAVVASHTTSGQVARKQADILASISPSVRFIWVHAQSEPDRSIHRELAERGVFIELDSLGWRPADDDTLITTIKELVAAGHRDRILLSHDAGWYQPGQPNGGTQKPYTYLQKIFIPKLLNNGLDEVTIRMITQENPIRAFAFMDRMAR